MSGTSLDGIDMACINLSVGKSWEYSFEATQTVHYNKKWEKKLRNLLKAPKDIVQKENKLYSVLLAETINSFIENNNLSNIDAICSHGHTLFHQPEKSITFQLGNQKTLASLTGLKVVCDFRIQDVALGGQGAPLVPVGDQLLFGNYDACLNLGGFANCSKTFDGELAAFDIGAVNTVLNFLAKKKGSPYDNRGEWAQRGSLIFPLFQALQALDFYSKDKPKSLGIEWVNDTIIPLLEFYSNHSVEDLLQTYTSHIGIQIGKIFDRGEKVLVSGGAVNNDYLMKEINKNSSASFEVPSKELIDFKEALIFGLLGVLRLRGEVNCFASVTGSSKDHSSGIIFTP